MTPSARARRAWIAWAAAVVACGLHFSLYASGSRPLLWDTRYYMYFASRIAHGAVPYRDFFENKTPLSIYVGALFDRLGHAAGVAPIHAIRAGFLALAALAGILTFAVFRRLGRGRWTVAFLGLLAQLAFPLLSWLPAFGVLPKLTMALCASATALACADGRFALAGVTGGLALLDWQIGGLALMGAAAAALAARRKVQALAAIAAGALAATAPLLAALALQGALAPAFGQTIGGLFGRTGPWWKTRPPAEKLGYLWMNVRAGCPGHSWLVLIGLSGIAIGIAEAFRSRRKPGRLRLLLPLLTYHCGVVAFSAYDFQSYGDLYILLHSMAFFLGLVFLALERTVRLAARRARFRLRLPAYALVAAIALTRPWLLGPRLDLRQRFVGPEASLADQQEVARAVFADDPDPAVVGPAELLFLAHRANRIHPVYWNSATYHYYRRSEEDDFIEPLDRILRRGHVRTLVLDAGVTTEPGDRIAASRDGAYRVIVRPNR